jgi:hypothetical protein
MEGVRERAGRILDRILEYAGVMQRIECCAGELNRYLNAPVLSLSTGRRLWEAEEVRVPVGRRVEPPRCLRPILGGGLDAERLSINAAGLFVEGREGGILQSARFNGKVRLRDIIWLALIVDDWGKVVGRVRDGDVRRCVEAVACAAEAARLALEREARGEACACSVKRFSERYRGLILDAVEVLAEEGKQSAAWDAGRWLVWLFDAGHLSMLTGTAVTLHPGREVRVPERVAELVASLHGIGPPFRVESVRAYEGDVELYVSGLAELGRRGTRQLQPILHGAAGIQEILLASCFTEEEDWAQLIAERRRLLGNLEEAYGRVKMAAALCGLLA